MEAFSLIGIPRAEGLVISLATSALYLAINSAGVLFLPAIPMEMRSQLFGTSQNTVNPDAADDRILRQNDVI